MAEIEKMTVWTVWIRLACMLSNNLANPMSIGSSLRLQSTSNPPNIFSDSFEGPNHKLYLYIQCS